MIKTARQLKDLIRNLSKKNAADAQILMRNYMMERFLERISLSSYRDKFILKGGMLVAAMVGLDARSTMDLDATVKAQGRDAGGRDGRPGRPLHDGPGRNGQGGQRQCRGCGEHDGRDHRRSH